MEIKTILNDESYLRQISLPVDFSDKSLFDDIEVLRDYCVNNQVFAIAGVQLGIPKRIIYVKKLD